MQRGGGLSKKLCRLCLLLLTLFLIPNSLKAEQSGWFVGVQGGYAKATQERLIDEMEVRRTRVEFRECAENWGAYCAGKPLNQIFQTSAGRAGSSRYSTINVSQDYTGYNAGLLAGYKHFFTAKFGLRLYTLFDASFFKNDDSAFYSKFQAYNYTLNLDLLYNLIVKDEFSLGVFGGVGAGGVHYVSGENAFDDINLGLNLGLRMNLSRHHGFEVYSRVSGNGFFQRLKGDKGGATTTSQSQIPTEFYQGCRRKNNPDRVTACTSNAADKTAVVTEYSYWSETTQSITSGGGLNTNSFSQPYQIGIRYIFSF